MKTAISIPDPIFEAAEDLAQRLGVSRSELYATAVRQYVESHQAEAITAALNEVYSEVDSSVDPVLNQLQWLALPYEEW
jgi:metal-responsive CopG/Arc/MetJ family transcriptional regulator